MKTLLIAAAATALFAAPALAQTNSANGTASPGGVTTDKRLPSVGSGTQIYGPAGQGFTGVAEGKYDRSGTAATATARSASATLGGPPAYWTGTASDWSAHQQACAQRYRTYNAATDMFYAQPGVQARCIRP